MRFRRTPSSAKRAAAAKSATSKTFGECATQYIDAKSPEWSNIKHVGQWRTTIETFAMPVIGNLSVQEVEGVPDHKDLFMTPQEHALNDQFTPCCSRSKSPRLVLDI